MHDVGQPSQPNGAEPEAQKEKETLPTLPHLKGTPIIAFADFLDPSAAVANGVPSPQSRASPLADGVPNGKPTGPYVERSNPLGPTNVAQTVSSKEPKAAAAAATDMRNVVRRKLTGYVGFANLPNQWHRKSVRKGFNFNVMVVGKFRSLTLHFSPTSLETMWLISEIDR